MAEIEQQAKTEEKSVTRVMSNDEFFALSRALEDRYAIFYKFWEIGKPIFSTKVPTAGVAFDHKTGDPLTFMFNPDFWERLTLYDRTFVISHEMLHIILNHGVRMRNADKFNHDVVNVCLDLVINELLVSKCHFSRNKITGSENYVWFDTLFEKNPNYNGPVPEKDKSFEYYYVFVKEHFPQVQINSPGKGDGKDGEKGKGGGGGDGDGEQNEGDGNFQTVDDHDGLSDQELEEVIKEMNEYLDDSDKEEVKEIIEKHFQNGEEAGEGDGDSPSGQQAGNVPGNIWTFSNVDVRKVKKKKKWETVIKKWVSSVLKSQFRDTEQWARLNRRFVSIGDGSLMFPSEMEIEDIFWDEDKIEVYFFQDTSVSCAHFKDRFFAAAASLPPEKFDIRMFCFDTSVYETTLESGKLYGFGGTTFTCIESKIQDVMQKEKTSYPKAVFIITDGYGNHVIPEKPDKWYWFLSCDYKNYIPAKSHTFLLKDFE